MIKNELMIKKKKWSYNDLYKLANIKNMKSIKRNHVYTINYFNGQYNQS